MQVCTSSHTTTPTSHHSIFYRPDALPTAQPKSVKALEESINQSKLFVTCAMSCTKLESEAWAVDSGRVLLIVIEKMGLEASFESI